MTSKRSYYDILQVSIKAEQEVIEAAYKRLALKYHPDKNNSVNATEYMQELNEAYSVLHDPRKRAEYDKAMNLSSTPHLSQKNPMKQNGVQMRKSARGKKQKEIIKPKSKIKMYSKNMGKACNSKGKKPKKFLKKATKS